MRPVHRTSVSDEIVAQITDLIARDVLKPGDRLPPERELCQRFGVGRSSLREALRSLSMMGILDGRVGEGTFVCDNSKYFEKALQWGFALDGKKLQDLSETRMMLESQNAYLAAERATAVDLEAIQDLDADAREGFQPIGLFELLKAFKQAMDMAPKIDFHAVERVEVTTEERIEFVMDVLAQRDQVPFADLISGHRIVVVVTFVAILELMKEGRLTVQQATSDGEIWVYRNEKRVVPNQESEYNG